MAASSTEVGCGTPHYANRSMQHVGSKCPTLLDRRLYRQADTGADAELTLDRVTGPGGARWWSVALVLTDGGTAAIAALPAVEWWLTREEAREGCRARLRALEAGWRQVELVTRRVRGKAVYLAKKTPRAASS
jgi:hypothetical protein